MRISFACVRPLALPCLMLGLCLLLLFAAGCAGRSAEQAGQGLDQTAAQSGQASSDASSPESTASDAASADPLAAGALSASLPPDADPDFDDYGAPALRPISDPFEVWNRFWFSFNDVFYTYLLKPVYSAYVFVTPEELRSGLKNVLTNALFPVRFINSLLQGKFQAAGVEMGRFIVNSTLGFGGLFDVTKGRKTVVDVDPGGEDFGQTLGVWGAGPGLYLVWPVIGPSNVRDTVGRAADWLVDPLLFIPSTTTVNMVTVGVWGGLRFNAAGEMISTYDDMKKMAIDPYIAMREMYMRYREGRIAQ